MDHRPLTAFVARPAAKKNAEGALAVQTEKRPLALKTDIR
jgi:hypothetical protein